MVLGSWTYVSDFVSAYPQGISCVNIEDLNIIGPPVVGASRMVAEAEPFELLFNVSTAAWLIKDKDMLARDYGINIEKNTLKQQNTEISVREHTLSGSENKSIRRTT